MSQALVTLDDERQLRGVIERFDTALPDFVLRADGGEPARLRFADVRSVGFLGDPAAPEPADPVVDRLVTVRLFDGESLRGALTRNEGQRRGVHLVPVEAGGIARWYVPMHAIRDVVSVLSLGDILLRKGLVPANAVAAAVERQRALRAQRLGEILQTQHAVNDAQVAQAVERQQHSPGKRIGDILLELGFVSEEQLAAAVQVQLMLRDKRLGEVLVEMGFTDDKTISIALALQFHLPFVSIAAGSIDPGLRTEVPAALARQWQLLPLSREGGFLTVAIADPTRLDFKGVLRARTGMVINEAVATRGDLARGVELFYR
jgi:hypothetical protein